MNIKGLDSLFRKIGQLKNIDIKPIIEDATERVRDEARKKAPVSTSELRNSIDCKVEPTPEGYKGIVFSNKEHAIYVELGTGPVGEAEHNGISPNVNPMYSPDGWVYYDEDLKRFVYTKGQPARPFMYPALHDNREKLSKYINNQLKKKIKEASK